MRIAVGLLDDVRDDHGDVVPGTHRECCLDESLGGRVTVRDREDLTDVLGGEVVGQAIAAQQQAITGSNVQVDDVQVGSAGLVVERAQEHRPVGVGASALGRELALVDEPLHMRVVGGHLGEVSATQRIDAGVADVADAHLLPIADHGDQGGPHRLQHRVGVRHLLQCSTSGTARVGDLGADVHAGRVVQLGEHSQRDRGGDLARGVPAHAVGEHEEPGAAERGVLIVGPDGAEVGLHGEAETHRHHPPPLLVSAAADGREGFRDSHYRAGTGRHAAEVPGRRATPSPLSRGDAQIAVTGRLTR